MFIEDYAHFVKVCENTVNEIKDHQKMKLDLTGEVHKLDTFILKLAEQQSTIAKILAEDAGVDE